MPKISTLKELKETILTLEIQQERSRVQVEKQIFEITDKLKPGNVARKFIPSLKGSSFDREDLAILALSNFSGYLAQKWIVRKSVNPFIRLAGSIAQFTVSRIISKNSEKITDVLKVINRKLIEKFN